MAVKYTETHRKVNWRQVCNKLNLFKFSEIFYLLSWNIIDYQHTVNIDETYILRKKIIKETLYLRNNLGRTYVWLYI